MAFEEIEKEAEEQYWNPTEVGESIEGNICAWIKDQRGFKVAVIDTTDDEGNDIKCIFPSHVDLRRCYKDLQIGDFIHAEVIKLRPIKNSKHKKRIYSMQVDPDKFVEYEEW